MKYNKKSVKLNWKTYNWKRTQLYPVNREQRLLQNHFIQESTYEKKISSER